MKPNDYIHHFTAADDVRLWLTRPARYLDKLYASDGHILIRTHDDTDVHCMDDSPLVSAAERMLEPLTERNNWISAQMGLPEKILCFVCGGIGKTTICDHCEGDGVVEAANGPHEIQCPKCGGIPVRGDENGVECDHCNGTGAGFQTVPVGNTFFQRRYLALLQTLPGPVLLSTHDNPKEVAFFHFSGGVGALMPCRYI